MGTSAFEWEIWPQAVYGGSPDEATGGPYGPTLWLRPAPDAAGGECAISYREPTARHERGARGARLALRTPHAFPSSVGSVPARFRLLLCLGGCHVLCTRTHGVGSALLTIVPPCAAIQCAHGALDVPRPCGRSGGGSHGRALRRAATTSRATRLEGAIGVNGDPRRGRSRLKWNACWRHIDDILGLVRAGCVVWV